MNQPTFSDPEALLAAIVAASGAVTLANGRVRLAGPPALLQSDLARHARAHKEALRTYLQTTDYPSTVPNDCNTATVNPIIGQVPERMEPPATVAVSREPCATPEEPTATGQLGQLQQVAETDAPASRLQQGHCNRAEPPLPEERSADMATVAVLQPSGSARARSTRAEETTPFPTVVYPSAFPTQGSQSNRPYWPCLVCNLRMWSSASQSHWYCSNCGALSGDEMPTWSCWCGAWRWVAAPVNGGVVSADGLRVRTHAQGIKRKGVGNERSAWMKQRVTFSPEAAELPGLPGDAAQVIELPDGFGTFTRAQRTAWAREQIQMVALEMLADVAAMHGKVPPTAAQQAAYLRAVQPGIDEALAGVGR